MLDSASKEQLKSVFANLASNYRILIEAQGHPAQKELTSLLLPRFLKCWLGGKCLDALPTEAETVLSPSFSNGHLN